MDTNDMLQALNQKNLDVAAPAHTNWELYFSTDSAWAAMAEAIASAKHQIQAEQYIFEDDALGRPMMELLIEKAKQDVKVFLVCDRYGSASLYHSELPELLRAAGGYIHFYNNPSLDMFIKPARMFPRTHVKMLAIDGEVGFIGGVCIAERMRGWRDTQIRVSGENARLMSKLLSSTETYLKRNKFSRLKNQPRRVYGDDGTMLLLSTPTSFKYTIYKSFVKHIRHAKHEIQISNAFFVPNRSFIRLLKKKAKEGVRITLMVPDHSDVRLADWVFLSHAHALIKAGIRVFAYKRQVLHCKTLVIDGHWCTIGSANMDILSFFFNREANLVSENPALNKALQSQFALDMQDCEEITMQRLQSRPVHQQVLGYMARILKVFLIKSKA